MKNASKTGSTMDPTEYRYSADWITKLETEEHWRLYWKQQELLQGRVSPGDSFLEIGVGTGFTANYLRSKGFSVSTFDIDKDKKPDIVGNIVTHEFDRQYDHILAFEVFEHIPYEKFIETLPGLDAICNKSLFISVPLGKKELFSAELKIPRIKKKGIYLKIPKRKLWKYHFWEIGYKGTSKKRFVDDLEASGFKLTKSEVHLMRVFFAFQKSK